MLEQRTPTLADLDRKPIYKIRILMDEFSSPEDIVFKGVIYHRGFARAVDGDFLYVAQPHEDYHVVDHLAEQSVTLKRF